MPPPKTRSAVAGFRPSAQKDKQMFNASYSYCCFFLPHETTRLKRAHRYDVVADDSSAHSVQKKLCCFCVGCWDLKQALPLDSRDSSTIEVNLVLKRRKPPPKRCDCLGSS